MSIAAASVRVDGVTKRYGAVEALGGVGFAVAPGEIFGLLGPNGAGKTTLLECILGLRRPDAGTVQIEGQDLRTADAAVRRCLGAQMQSATLQDKITPREALGLFASFYQPAAPVGELLGRFGLEEKADARFAALSGGQRQRLFLALAFVNRPRVVILDEPTAGLDPPARRELHGLIAAGPAAGTTVVLSTHDLDEAQRLCDRVAIIDRGKILAVARPAELIAASRRAPRLQFRTARALTASQCQTLAGAGACVPHGDSWMLESANPTRTVADLMRLLEAAGNELLDLQIHRPTLEDVFLELTGHTWPGTAKEEDEP